MNEWVVPIAVKVTITSQILCYPPKTISLSGYGDSVTGVTSSKITGNHGTDKSGKPNALDSADE